MGVYLYDSSYWSGRNRTFNGEKGELSSSRVRNDLTNHAWGPFANFKSKNYNNLEVKNSRRNKNLLRS